MQRKVFAVVVELGRQEKGNFVYGMVEIGEEGILGFTKGEIFQIRYCNISEGRHV